MLIPSMGRLASNSLAAVLKGCGFNARAYRESDEAILKLGRANASCKECLPLLLTTGTMLSYLNNGRRPDEVVIYFMATGQGPCRFGQYAVFMEDLIKPAGDPGRGPPFHLLCQCLCRHGQPVRTPGLVGRHRLRCHGGRPVHAPGQRLSIPPRPQRCTKRSGKRSSWPWKRGSYGSLMAQLEAKRGPSEGDTPQAAAGGRACHRPGRGNFRPPGLPLPPMADGTPREEGFRRHLRAPSPNGSTTAIISWKRG